MKKMGARFMAAILAVQLALGTGSTYVYAAENQDSVSEDAAVSEAALSENQESYDENNRNEGEISKEQTDAGIAESTENDGQSSDDESGQDDKTSDTGTNQSNETQDSGTLGESDVNSGGADNESQPADTVLESGQSDNTEESETQNDVQTDESENESDSESEEAGEKRVLNGSIEVDLTAGMEVYRDQTFHITVNGIEKEAVLAYEGGNEAPQASVAFENLEAGRDYEVTVAAQGYVTYRQTIHVQGMDYKISLYTGKAEGFDENLHPGVLVYGDVSGNGTLDETDAENIVDAIDSHVYDEICDLNKDNEVNLIDLQYFTKYYDGFEQTYSTVEAYIPREAADVEKDENTQITGDLESIWQEDGKVGLATASGAAISESNPVSLSFDFSQNSEAVVMEGFMVEAPENSQNQIEAGTVFVYLENSEEPVEIPIQAAQAAMYRQGGMSAVKNADGTIIVNLGGQIAVKKVTIKITAAGNQSNLAEISKVEFLNDMESHIPAPEMDIPKEVTAKAGNKQITLSWKPARNVTGYEVFVSDGSASEIKKTTRTSITIDSFNGKKLENKKVYTLKVQSVNGSWKSGFSQEVTAMPKADAVPDAPDELTVTALYKALDIKWKAPKDNAADYYSLYYKEDGADSYEKIEKITGTYYQLSDLKDNTKYMIYVTASNDLGEGPASLTVSAETAKVADVKFPQYELINDGGGDGNLTNHIISAKRVVGSMVDSPMDDANTLTANGLVDNNFGSYYYLQDWDEAVEYHKWQWGLSFELDNTYKMDRFVLTVPDNSYSYYSRAAVYYFDEEAQKEVEAPGVSLLQKKDENGNIYYTIKLSEPITAKKIRFGISTGWTRKIAVSEIKFYNYDSLEADIMALYADDLHLELKEGVSEADFEELQERLDTKHNGEYHPDRELLQKELDAARQLLTEQADLSDVVQVNTEISSSKDKNLGITGLNAWQPLGVSAAAGSDLIVYVGSPSKKTGDAVPLNLVFTQFHGQSGEVSKISVQLKAGRNEISVPQLTQTDAEKGGPVYVQYSGKGGEQYAVRVSGAEKFPVLNLYGVTDEGDKKEKIRTYVEALENYTAELADAHENHSGQNQSVQYSYDEKHCILNTTDIMLDTMMLSLPATQVIAGLGSGDKVQTLENSVTAMNEMMTLFYQHKGLTDSFTEDNSQEVVSTNSLPSQHLNIRYMKMFSGAFMYASGNHIGVEWNETKGMVNGKPVVTDGNGRKISGGYFGWGITHEIGHEINQSAYAVAEVTNNYFALLAQADETNSGVRFSYDDVYEKVTSGNVGPSSNVFTQLAMYWQLHLAYDRGYNYKTYSNYNEIFNNLFYARVDSYARNTKLAPSPDGTALTLGSDKNQNFMRLASAAAQKDLTDYFTRWGLVPDETTKAYMAQFEPEQRALYYINDEARAYEIENGTSGTVAGKDIVSAQLKAQDSSVTLTLNSTENADKLIGYEIIRVTKAQGKDEKEVIGFTTSDTFVDNASSLGNRTVSYEIAAVDKFGNRSAVKATEAVKLEGDGLYDKALWEIQTNMTSKDDTQSDASEENPCEPQKQPAALKMIDADMTTIYKGTAENEDPYMILKMNKDTEISAIRYTMAGDGQPIGDYRIEISSDGSHYTKVKEGQFALENGRQTVYLTNRDIEGHEDEAPWVATYNASYVKLTAVGQKGREIAVSELDVFGPSGDNIEFGKDTFVGRLKTDYVYQEAGSGQEALKIPAGSVIFTGSYKGNPAYNVVMLYDDKGNVVGGTDEDGSLKAEQIILAPDPGEAELGEVSEGIWIYWINPETEMDMPEAVRAELYRVDDALTNEGQRLVSDTLTVQVPKELPEIELNK